MQLNENGTPTRSGLKSIFVMNSFNSSGGGDNIKFIKGVKEKERGLEVEHKEASNP